MFEICDTLDVLRGNLTSDFVHTRNSSSHIEFVVMIKFMMLKYCL